jgi:hypothetical protein
LELVRLTPPPSPLPIAISILEVEFVGAWRGGTAFAPSIDVRGLNFRLSEVHI